MVRGWKTSWRWPILDSELPFASLCVAFPELPEGSSDRQSCREQPDTRFPDERAYAQGPWLLCSQAK
ncbi:MAG: hypothetical protein U9N87_15300 [Planctomycetota bacterium]|nr:hypothetical protein [Planctomycetota bacterium]